jgi:predicted restriction endonuclease
VPDFELRRLFELTQRFAGESPGFAEDSQAEFSLATLPKRTKTSKFVRRAAVRFEMLLHYGKQCPFTFELGESLDELRCALEVGHLRPLRFGGKDHIQNVVPMSGFANWAWDEGLISLKNDGTLLFAAGIKESTRRRFDGCKRILFPRDARV